MSKILITLFFCFVLTGFHNISFAQVKPDSTELPTVVEEQLENLTESNEDNTTEDDSYLQDINYFVKHPLNLNYADQGLLEQLQLLTPVQISNLLSYRKLFGNLISIYELQAIPTWNVSMIKRILPYITVSENLNVFKSLKSRFKDGSTTVLLRGTQILEDQKGYILNKDSVQNFYPGSPQKVLLRYKYKFGNLLQYGFTAEKDGGEQFFKGAQKKGFDFYSAHLFIRNLGVIKALALGDFVINMGQGLTQWQSLSFSRGALSAKRQSDVLRPYNSAGEVTFNRGIGITLQKKNWEATGFASYRRLDASFNVDTLNFEDYISSLYNTGFHRTANEVAGRNTQGQLSLGGNVSYSTSQFHIGANAIHYDFEHTIQKASLLYNKYAISGKQLGNYSVDYSFTYRNMHFFGEAAVDNRTDYAFVNGLALSVNSKVDMSFLYRKISPQYQSLYTSAFTESTFPTNESGFYTSIDIAPTDKIRINAYADYFHFPWVKYRIDAPSYGRDYLVQFTYTPDRNVEIYARYNNKNKAINFNPDDKVLNPVDNKNKQGLRVQFRYKLNRTFTIRSRVDLSWYDKRGNDAQTGFLTYFDIIYKKVFSPVSGNIRLLYFETTGYDARLYAFENDVLYGYSIPVFSGKGYRYYLNINYKLNKSFQFWGRLAQTIYLDRDQVGSGLDLINGNKRTEVKLQAQYSF